MSRVRTCRTRQILRLPAWRLRGIWLWSMLCRERLTICPVHWRRLPHSAPDGMSWHKCLSLSRNWCENAVLIESQAIGAAAVVGGLKSRAPDLKPEM